MKRTLACLLAIPVLLPALAFGKGGRSRPIATYTRGGMPNIQAQAAVAIDLSTGEELYTKNPDAVRPIASISKMMAMLVVLDPTRHLDLDAATQMIDSDRQIAMGGARSRLPIGMSFTNRDLLHAALMASDNRAVPALGRAVGLNPHQLVEAMNAKAKDLGMKSTKFEDPVGLNANNTSTPRDLVHMLKAAIKQPLIAEITQKAKYVAHPVGHPGWTIEYNNTDLIARSGKFSVLTGKTGYTDLALYCLAIAVRMEAGASHDVGMVFLGAVGKMTRFADFHRTAQWLQERKWKSTAAADANSPM
ncbi:MAG TPA: serine hydrolase [Polyangia bacterium]|nr:serine hydrolase [Polyangia bacterium]